MINGLGWMVGEVLPDGCCDQSDRRRRDRWRRAVLVFLLQIVILFFFIIPFAISAMLARRRS